MNINVDKAVEDLTWSAIGGEISKAAQTQPNIESLGKLFREILEKNANHNELEQQMPEPM